MAEGGLLSGMLGGEEEAPEFEGAAEGLIEADAFAAAVAADQAKLDPRVARATVGFLEQQTRLLKVQTKHLEDEHALRLSHLRNQSQEGRLRRTGQRLRLGMQAGVALLFAAVGLGLIIMVVDAITSNEVIVEAFDTSPGLAATGITGKVAANAVLDALQELQGATRSVEKGPNAQTAWSSDVQIEVPETGVSIGEIDRLLHQHFGHDLHISGDVRQTPSGGVLLTIRGDDVPARSFAGSAADFDKLAVASAEYAYGSAQPARFAVYLVNNNRNADALSFLPGAFARAGSNELRAKLANGWGNAYLGLNQPAQAAEKYRLAITLDANLWNPRSNLPLVLQLTDGENAGWRASQDFLQAARRAPAAQRPPLRLLENAASFTWDLPLLLAALQDDSRYNGGAGSATNIDGPLIADTYALMHDWDAAARSMEASAPDDAQTKAEALLLQGTGAMERGDFAAAGGVLEGLAGEPGSADDLFGQSVQSLPGLWHGRACGRRGGAVQKCRAVVALCRVPWRCACPCGRFRRGCANLGRVASARAGSAACLFASRPVCARPRRYCRCHQRFRRGHLPRAALCRPAEILGRRARAPGFVEGVR